MTKELELSDPNSCFNKARPDEQIFVLREKDLAAPETILYWIQQRMRLMLNIAGDEKLTAAKQWVVDVMCIQSQAMKLKNEELARNRKPRIFA